MVFLRLLGGLMIRVSFSIFNTNETSISIPWKKLELEQRSFNFLTGNNNLLPKHGYGIYEVN